MYAVGNAIKKTWMGKLNAVNVSAQSCLSEMTGVWHTRRYEMIDPKAYICRRYKPRQCILKEGDVRVCIAGGAGNLGSKLGLLLKTSSVLDGITMFDTEKHTEGIALDLGHINTKCKIFRFTKKDQLHAALVGNSIVVICTSGKCKPAVTAEEIFETNAKIVEEIATAAVLACPQAFIVIVSQPIDSLVPLVSQIYQDAGLNSRKKVIGVTSSNIMRATRYLCDALHCNPVDIIVPVLGGHTSNTIVPVYSACMPRPDTNDAEEMYLCNKMLAVYKSKEPTEHIQRMISNLSYLVKNWESCRLDTNTYDHGATITGAMAAYRTVNNIAKAMKTKELIPDTAFVETDVVPGLTYSTVPLQYGPDGVHECFNVPVQTLFEQSMLEEASTHLQLAIRKGREYAVNCIINRTLGTRHTP